MYNYKEAIKDLIGNGFTINPCINDVHLLAWDNDTWQASKNKMYLTKTHKCNITVDYNSFAFDYGRLYYTIYSRDIPIDVIKLTIVLSKLDNYSISFLIKKRFNFGKILDVVEQGKYNQPYYDRYYKTKAWQSIKTLFNELELNEMN
jgi:hypothetical protein